MPALPESLLAQLAALTPAQLAGLSESDRVEVKAALDEHELSTERLLDYVPRVSPYLIRPDHLAKVASLFERARSGERVRACVSVPSQHGKTELLLHGVGWWLRTLPRDTLAYATYSQDQANSKSFDARNYAQAGSVPLAAERQNLQEWRTARGGGAFFTGVGGPLTGQPLCCALVDDPYKNRVEAESPTVRKHVLGWFKSVVMTRFQEGGSIIVVHTRWVPDDLIGVLEAGECGRYEVINLPFLARREANGKLVPDTTGDVVLNPQRIVPGGKLFGWTPAGARQHLVDIGPYDAASIYQGEPRPREGKVFKDPARFTELNLDGARIKLAVDPAGSDNPKANATVAVALAFRGYGPTMTADLVGLIRFKKRPEHAAPLLFAFQRRFGARLHIEGSRDGREQARCLHLVDQNLDLELINAIGDKFLRAQPASGGWNNGRLRVPFSADLIDATDEDLAEFLRVVTNFTGLGGSEEDDDVDALAHDWNLGALEVEPEEDVPPPDEPITVHTNW